MADNALFVGVSIDIRVAALFCDCLSIVVLFLQLTIACCSFLRLSIIYSPIFETVYHLLPYFYDCLSFTALFFRLSIYTVDALFIFQGFLSVPFNFRSDHIQYIVQDCTLKPAEEA